MKKLLLLTIVSLSMVGCGFEIVDTGHRGVKTEFGKVVGESLTEGIYFYNPISTNITEMDVRTQNVTLKTLCYSKDAQVVEVTVQTNLNLLPAAAHVIFREVGYDWDTKIVGPILQGVTKEIIGQYKAVDLISNRNKVTNQIKAALTEKLASKNFSLTNMEISNLDFDDSFEAAVRDKVIAVERPKESKNKTVRVQEEANQQVIAATAEAKSMQIRAKALTQNKSLVQYEAVQKWDGKMPKYMLGNGAMPFLNITPGK